MSRGGPWVRFRAGAVHFFVMGSLGQLSGVRVMSWVCKYLSRAGSLTLCHVGSTALIGFFQPNRRPGSDSDHQNESIGGVFKSICVLDIFFRATFFKSAFLGFANKNTCLKKIVDFCCPALYVTVAGG